MGTWFEWLRCFAVVPTIGAGSLPMVSAFIIRSRSFGAAQGQLRVYTFFVKGLGQGAQMQRNDCSVMMIFVFVKGVGQGAQMQRKDCSVMMIFVFVKGLGQ